MWVLLSLNKKDLKYRLLSGKDYKVGRKDAEILLQSDQSISRAHALFKVTHLEGNVAQPHKLPILTVTDASRFGSAVAGEKFKNTTKDVNTGDEVTFGTTGESRFKAVYEPFIVTTSCLDTAEKKTMKQLMQTLGGHMVGEWRKQCNLLVMSRLSVTLKTVCALINQKAIVTVDYLTALIAAMKENKETPDPEDFLPPIVESQLNPNDVSFKKNPGRQTLFQGMIFVFLHPKQFKKLSMAVDCAGGTPMLMEEEPDENEDETLVAPGTCVLFCDPADKALTFSDNAKQWVQHVSALLRRKKKRMVPDSEIGYAVLYCSTQKFCNPDETDVSAPGMNLPSQSLSLRPMDDGASQQVRVADSLDNTTRSTRNASSTDVSVVGDSFVAETEQTSIAGRSTRSNRSSTTHVDETLPQKRDRKSTARFAIPQVPNKKVAVKDEPVSQTKPGTSNSPGRGRRTVVAERTTEARSLRTRRGDAAPPVAASNLKDDQSSENDLFSAEATQPRRDPNLPEEAAPSPPRSPERDPSSPRRSPRRGSSPPPKSPVQKATKREASPSPRSPVRKMPKRDVGSNSPARKAVGSSSRSPVRKTPKVEVDMSQNVDDMLDSIPARRGRRRNRSPTPDPPAAPASPAPGPSTTRGRAAEAEDADSDADNPFDDLPTTRRRGGRKRSPSPAALKQEAPPKKHARPSVVVDAKANIDDAFENIPSRRSRRAKERSPTPPPPPAATASVKVNQSPVPKKVSSPRKGQQQRNEGASTSAAPVKPEPITPAKPAVADAGPSRVARPGTVDVPTGFLTAAKPIAEQRCTVDRDYAVEGPVEPGTMQLEEASLMVVQPGKTSTALPAAANRMRQTNLQDGTTTWKGKVVKNFKKFRKTANVGAGALPRIIGGSDLVVHKFGANKEREEWLQELERAESQQNEEEANARQLFEWEPPSRPRGGRR